MKLTANQRGRWRSLSPWHWFAPYRNLPASVYALFLGNIVNSLGNFVFPFLTFYLTDRLGYATGRAGFIVTLACASWVPGSLVGGKLADRFGRKGVFLLSRVLAAACFVPCAFLGISPVVPWLLIAAGIFGGAADPAHAAMLTDLTDATTRHGAFSLLYLGHNIGFAVGPLIAGLLYRHHTPWLFLGDALTTLLSLVLVALLVPETRPDKHGAGRDSEGLSEAERAEEGGVIAALLRRPYLVVFSLILMVYSFVYTQFTFTLPMYLRQTFAASGPALFGELMTVNALTVVFITAPLTRYTQHIRPTRNICVGGMLYAIGVGMLYFVQRPAAYVLATFIFSLGEIMVTTNSGVYLANSTPASHRGRFHGLLPQIWGAGYALGPWINGQIVGTTGVRWMWPFGFCLGLGGVALMYALEAAHPSARRAEVGAPPVPAD